MDMARQRMRAGIALVLLPFIYAGGIYLYRGGHYALGELIILAFMFLSVVIGITAALTYKNAIFGINCGSLLGYSISIIVTAFTLQALELTIGAWIMYGLFAISFVAGIITIFKNKKRDI